MTDQNAIGKNNYLIESDDLHSDFGIALKGFLRLAMWSLGLEKEKNFSEKNSM